MQAITRRYPLSESELPGELKSHFEILSYMRNINLMALNNDFLFPIVIAALESSLFYEDREVAQSMIATIFEASSGDPSLSDYLTRIIQGNDAESLDQLILNPEYTNRVIALAYRLVQMYRGKLNPNLKDYEILALALRARLTVFYYMDSNTVRIKETGKSSRLHIYVLYYANCWFLMYTNKQNYGFDTKLLVKNNLKGKSWACFCSVSKSCSHTHYNFEKEINRNQSQRQSHDRQAKNSHAISSGNTHNPPTSHSGQQPIPGQTRGQTNGNYQPNQMLNYPGQSSANSNPAQINGTPQGKDFSAYGPSPGQNSNHTQPAIMNPLSQPNPSGFDPKVDQNANIPTNFHPPVTKHGNLPINNQPVTQFPQTGGQMPSGNQQFAANNTNPETNKPAITQPNTMIKSPFPGNTNLSSPNKPPPLGPKLTQNGNTAPNFQPPETKQGNLPTHGQPMTQLPQTDGQIPSRYQQHMVPHTNPESNQHINTQSNTRMTYPFPGITNPSSPQKLPFLGPEKGQKTNNIPDIQSYGSKGDNLPPINQPVSQNPQTGNQIPSEHQKYDFPNSNPENLAGNMVDTSIEHGFNPKVGNRSPFNQEPIHLPNIKPVVNSNVSSPESRIPNIRPPESNASNEERQKLNSYDASNIDSTKESAKLNTELNGSGRSPMRSQTEISAGVPFSNSRQSQRLEIESYHICIDQADPIPEEMRNLMRTLMSFNHQPLKSQEELNSCLNQMNQFKSSINQMKELLSGYEAQYKSATEDLSRFLTHQNYDLNAVNAWPEIKTSLEESMRQNSCLLCDKQTKTKNIDCGCSICDTCLNNSQLAMKKCKCNKSLVIIQNTPEIESFGSQSSITNEQIEESKEDYSELSRQNKTFNCMKCKEQFHSLACDCTCTNCAISSSSENSCRMCHKVYPDNVLKKRSQVCRLCNKYSGKRIRMPCNNKICKHCLLQKYKEGLFGCPFKDDCQVDDQYIFDKLKKKFSDLVPYEYRCLDCQRTDDLVCKCSCSRCSPLVLDICQRCKSRSKHN